MEIAFPLPPHELNPINFQQQDQEEQLEQEQQVQVQVEQQQHQQQEQHQIAIPISLPPPNLPCLDLLEGSREEYVNIGIPLYQASMRGDWKAAKVIFEEKPELVRFAITENFDTPLHVAASAKSTKSVEEFLENLVKLMEKEDMELVNKSFNTAFTLAATVGDVNKAKIMLERNKGLLEIPGSQGMMPLYVAALYARVDMVRYLYLNSKKMSRDFWTHENRGWVLHKCVEADMFDVAIQIVNDRPELMSNKRILRDILLLLARKKTDAFIGTKQHIILRIINAISAVLYLSVGHVERESDALQLLKTIWNKVVIMPKKDIDEIIRGPPLVTEELQQKKTLSGVVIDEHKVKNITYPSRVLFVAAKMGNRIFIIHLIKTYPDLIWKVDDKGLTIFHMAVKRRQAAIYNLIYEIGAMKDLIIPIKDDNGNNMLHLVSKIARQKELQNVSGVALQIQWELLWFQEVEQMIPPAYRQTKNKDGEKPHDLFKISHQMLVTEGEKWMKHTAAQCMVVATLIATIVFAAAFTLPGGYDQNTGIPIFHQKAALVVFVTADAISLIFSSASILMFLSILISRYALRDFLYSLPKKLMFGLGTLFLSIVTMMISFSASFFVLYNKNLKWIPIMVIGFIAMPVILFPFLQFHLLWDVFYSTYRSRYLFKPMKHTLY